MVFTETLSWGFRQFFPTGTYAGIGTTFVEFENAMLVPQKKTFNRHGKSLLNFSRFEIFRFYGFWGPSWFLGIFRILISINVTEGSVVYRCALHILTTNEHGTNLPISNLVSQRKWLADPYILLLCKQKLLQYNVIKMNKSIIVSKTYCVSIQSVPKYS